MITVEGLLELLSLCMLRCGVADRVTVVLVDLLFADVTVPWRDCASLLLPLLAVELVETAVLLLLTVDPVVETVELLLATELDEFTGAFLLPGSGFDFA